MTEKKFAPENSKKDGKIIEALTQDDKDTLEKTGGQWTPGKSGKNAEESRHDAEIKQFLERRKGMCWPTLEEEAAAVVEEGPHHPEEIHPLKGEDWRRREDEVVAFSSIGQIDSSIEMSDNTVMFLEQYKAGLIRQIETLRKHTKLGKNTTSDKRISILRELRALWDNHRRAEEALEEIHALDTPLLIEDPKSWGFKLARGINQLGKKIEALIYKRTMIETGEEPAALNEKIMKLKKRFAMLYLELQTKGKEEQKKRSKGDIS